MGVGLAKLGVGRGDVMMILLPNCPGFVFSFLGGCWIGVITTLANPQYTPNEIANQDNILGSHIVITQATYVEKLKNAMQHVVIVIFEDPSPEGCVALSLFAQQHSVILYLKFLSSSNCMID